MIQCIIVEDEMPSAERIRFLLETGHSKEIEVLAVLTSAEEVFRYFEGRKARIDLAFFDVEIGSYTAFELLDQIGPIDFKIIFTTAHEAYALRAIKISAIDYLLKPIDQDELALAVTNFIQEESKKLVMKNTTLPAFGLGEKKLKQKLALPSILGIEYIEVKDLIRCQADINYTHFFVRGGRKITVSKTLKEYETMLRPHGFFRVHNSHLVNLQEVKMYNKGKGGFIFLSDGSEIEVASRRKEELLQLLREF